MSLVRVNKFIIYDNKIRFGTVSLHVDLLDKDYRPTLVKGGGRWECDPMQYGNYLFIFGKSFDFGQFNKEDFLAAWENTKNDRPAFSKLELIISYNEYFSDVLQEFDENKNKQS